MEPWPNGAVVSQARIARPTDELEQVESFYREGLGLAVLGRFSGHAGCDGVMPGLPYRSCRLEFTRHEAASPCPAPSPDNLPVLYIPDPTSLAGIVDRLARLGHRRVEPENPYWKTGGSTFEDPDGWRVVLVVGAGIGSGG